MRLRSFSLIAAGAFSAAGLALLMAARPAPPDERNPIHPLTPELRVEAARRDHSVAPTLRVRDTEGDTIDLAVLTRNGPAFLLFIMNDCPCSIEAQPFFQRMYDAFGGKVPFVGITDGTMAQGRDWKAHFQMTFPLISDPKKDLMRAFGAKHSAYTALIGKDGRVVKLWPGYDRPMLREIASTVAHEAGVPTPNFDVSDAPTKPTTGCVF